MLFSLVLTALLSSSSVIAVWPQPRESSKIVLPIIYLNPANFTISQNLTSAPADLLKAINATQNSLSSLTFQYLSPSRGAEFFNNTKPISPPTLKHLSLGLIGGNGTVLSIFQEAVLPIESRDESYSLGFENTSAGLNATIMANTTLGLYRGLTTFEQLFYAQANTSANFLYALNVSDTTLDYPRFPWRGLLLDTSRNYFPLDIIRKTIDTMAFVKLNVFYWHITDSQSWPLALSKYPELTKAAYSVDEIYTENDISGIIQYAGERGIDVVLELDSPGHTASIAESHPDYVACNEAQPWAGFANEPPAGQIRFMDEKVSDFMNGVMNATLGLVKSQYWSVGGDEMNEVCWNNDTVSVELLKSQNRTLGNALVEYFNSLQKTVKDDGKTTVAWQETVYTPVTPGVAPPVTQNLTISNDTIILPWIQAADAAAIVDLGYRIVHASYEYFYLDCGGGNWIPKSGPGLTTKRQSWCDPIKTWDLIYSFDPFVNITETSYSRVLGGQTFLWTEQTDATNMEGKLWPRSAASAEVFWTGAEPGQYPLDAVANMPRMHEIRYRLVERGVAAGPLAPHYCALRPGACV